MNLDLDNENTFWAVIWLMAFTAFCIIVTVIAVCHAVNVDRYTSRGYTQTTLPGSDCAAWVKEAR